MLVIAAWLITFSFIIDNYWSGNSSAKAVKENLETYVQNQERDYESLLKDNKILKQIDANNFEEGILLKLTQKKYFFFRYFINDIGQYQLIFWNTQTVIPSAALLSSIDNTGFIKLDNGYYVWKKNKSVNSVTVALIPVKWDYFVTNTYLQNNFVDNLAIEHQYDITTKPTSALVKSVSGKELFYISERAGTIVSKSNPIAVGLRLFAALLILIFIHLIASGIAKNKGITYGLTFLVIVMAALRLISYYYPIPLNFRQFELFDPSIYGSNMILRSLGDLLINALLFSWIVLFIHSHLNDTDNKPKIERGNYKWITLFFVSLILLVISFVAAQTIRSMVSDSQISFDVINFFTLNIYSVTGFIVLCCIAIGYFLLSQILLFFIQSSFSKNFVALYLTVSIGGLIYLSFRLSIADSGFEIIILAWLIVYLFLLLRDDLTLSIKKIKSSKLIFWLFYFSVTITAIIMMENNKKELRSREHYAETLATKTDPANEILLNTLLTEFRNGFLADNFYRFKISKVSNQFLKDSLVNVNFSVYTNKYDTKVYTFDAKESPLFNNDNLGFNELNTVLKTQSKPTNLPDLFYYDESYDRFSYISRKTITDFDGDTLGYLFVLANPKKYKTDAINLELFSKGKNTAIENSPIYAFAVYEKLQLVDSHNDYAFATRLAKSQVPQNEFSTFKKNGYDELWYNAGGQKVVVITKENNFLIESITLFSYLFCAFLLITGFFWLLNVLIRARFNRHLFKNYWQLSIRNQIHGTVIFISVLSFLVIGIATILFFINRYQNSNREKLSRVIHVMENEVKISLSEPSVSENISTIYSDSNRNNLEKLIDKISEIHAVDVNMYDLDGNLQVSSLPLPYKKGVISTKMDPTAYYHLNQKNEVQYFQKEKIGKLDFVSNYVPVIDASGRVYAYLNIPYFTSQSKLQEEIANFLVTIINLNAFIFLIAGIVALFITNRITRSFTFISERMKAVNLGSHNEAIEWKRDDEIGVLIKEYNKMVAKLDESVISLAKNEREEAWREMARQVAHEIKNPLTPMKLSLQYLQKSIANKTDNVEQLTANVANTLVEQIDYLSHIAGEFGQFANIANAKNEIVDVNEIINQVVQLHKGDDSLQISWAPVRESIWLFADRTHLNRLFTNLILNALQAIPTDRVVRIQLAEQIIVNHVVISIEDNGVGIEEELQSKIFAPNFTTKTSGTGLGLAMSKGIVEQAKGKIWFKTKVGEGTIFFVELPMANI